MIDDFIDWSTVPEDVSDWAGLGNVGSLDFGGDPWSGNALDFGAIGNFGDQMVLDTTTGQTISLSEAFRLDPGAAQEYARSAGLQAPPASLPGLGSIGPALPSLPGGGGSSLMDWIGANPLQATAMGIGAGTLGIGLAGIIQKAMAGDPQATVTLQRQIASASPEERQAIEQAVRGLGQVQNFAMGGPASLQGQIGGRVPGEEAAHTDALARLGAEASRLGEYTGAIQPNLAGGLPGLLGDQESILRAFTPTATNIARGQLPITPELEQSVEQAFSPAMGDLASQLIEAARQRGFAGGSELLLQAPASAIGQTALRDLQGQMAGAKLNLAQQFPQLVAQASGAYSTPAALRMQGASQLGNLNQNLIAALGGFGQQGMGNRLDFLRAATSPLQASGFLASQQQAGRLGAGGQTQTTTTPGSLLESFAPLASLLGGAGNMLVGAGMLSGAPYSLSGRR